ncbi:MAG: polysaccharide deacetylase family protein, partial [Ignavibacteriales bacterium]|nr:polysaccharide deacetylase family protein [Ignavibacteriales bacterium]
DTFTTPVAAPYIPYPIGVRSYAQRWHNIRFLARVIREHRINVVVAHSRAASWVANIACWITRTPFVSTVHGKQHLHFSSTAVSIYGRHIIAISENLRQHLMNDLGISPSHVAMIPNGLVVEQWNKPKRLPHETGPSRRSLFNVDGRTRVLLLVGRLSGPKGDVAKFLMTQVLPRLRRHIRVSLAIVGGMKMNEDIPPAIESIRASHGTSSVLLLGFQKDIKPYLFHADVVIAAGRSAVESAVAGRPTVALGETNYHGLLTPENLEEAMCTEFGDQGALSMPSADRVADDLSAILKKPNASAVRSVSMKMRERYDMRAIVPRVHRVYTNAIVETLSPASIPVLMYHRVVPKEPTEWKHGIWVTREQFRTQLASLRRRGFQSVTFHDYAKFMKGEFSLPKKPVMLTFDDGYEDNYTEAYPLMEEFGMKGIIYLVADRRRTNFWVPEEPNTPLMSKTQIREMAVNGHEFGSHTISHLRLPEADGRTAEREIRESKNRCEALAGKEVVSFAYPFGACSEEAKRLVRDAGYQFAVAADTGPLKFYDDFFEIRRAQVFPWTNAFGFWKKTQPWYIRYKARKHSGK